MQLEWEELNTSCFANFRVDRAARKTCELWCMVSSEYQTSFNKLDAFEMNVYDIQTVSFQGGSRTLVCTFVILQA